MPDADKHLREKRRQHEEKQLGGDTPLAPSRSGQPTRSESSY